MMDYSIRLSRYRNYLLVCRMMKLNKDTNQKMIMMNEEYSKVKMKLENSQLKMLEVLSLLVAIIGLMIAGISDYSLVIAPVLADLCTTPVALSAPPNSYQNNSQS